MPFAGRAQSVVLVVGCFAVLLSLYGGRFAAMTPYIGELFRSRDVGAIHGRVLTPGALDQQAGMKGPAALAPLAPSGRRRPDHRLSPGRTGSVPRLPSGTRASAGP